MNRADDANTLRRFLAQLAAPIDVVEASERLIGSSAPLHFGALAETEIRCDLAVGSLRRFLQHWMEQPPLVRASVADNLVRWAMQLESKDYYRLIDPLQREWVAARMPRRHRVHEQFVRAGRALRVFAMELVVQGDNEAEERGIDADTKGSGAEARSIGADTKVAAAPTRTRRKAKPKRSASK